eukprot:11202238-Lingulodinium_polyedra.AAC.1
MAAASSIAFARGSSSTGPAPGISLCGLRPDTGFTFDPVPLPEERLSCTGCELPAARTIQTT